ncbi:MAG: small multi-drug export protein [Clostridia bacterium]|nr:small multi-drug export protein [Clostridia bacterium]
MIEALEAYLAGINHELAVFLISMIPIVELRGAIPYGVALGVNEVLAYFLAVLGNMLPVPFIIWFFRPVINYLEKTKIFGKLASKLKKRTSNKMKDMNKRKLLGLYIFVAVPLPGTGAWTGAAIAALMKMRIKHSFWVIFAGVASAGIIMMTGSKIVEFIINIF